MEYIIKFNRACAVVTLSMLYVIMNQVGPDIMTIVLAALVIGRNIFTSTMVQASILVVEGICIAYLPTHVVPGPILPIIHGTFQCAVASTVVYMVVQKCIKYNRRRILPTRLVTIGHNTNSAARTNTTDITDITHLNRIDRIAPVLNYTESMQCCVCLDDLLATQPHRRLPCNHAFHAQCIDRWLVQQSIMTCPVCRYRL